MTIFCARSRRKGCFSQSPPLRTGDSVWPASHSFSRQHGVSVSAVSFRHHSLAKRNGARRRTGLRGKGGRRGGWCRGRIWSGRRPPFPFCFPNALHHSVWPKMVQRETQVQTEISKTGVDLHWQECQTEPPAREGTKNRSRKLLRRSLSSNLPSCGNGLVTCTIISFELYQIRPPL